MLPILSWAALRNQICALLPSSLAVMVFLYWLPAVYGRDRGYLSSPRCVESPSSRDLFYICFTVSGFIIAGFVFPLAVVGDDVPLACVLFHGLSHGFESYRRFSTL